METIKMTNAKLKMSWPNSNSCFHVSSHYTDNKSGKAVKLSLIKSRQKFSRSNNCKLPSILACLPFTALWFEEWTRQENSRL